MEHFELIESFLGTGPINVQWGTVGVFAEVRHGRDLEWIRRKFGQVLQHYTLVEQRVDDYGRRLVFRKGNREIILWKEE